MNPRRFRNTVLSALAGLWVLPGCGPAEPRTVLVREGGRWVKVVAVKGTARGELALITLYYREDKDYSKVIDAAKEFRKKYPIDFRREDVTMLAGHAQMSRGYYFKAYEWYDRQLNEFPVGELSEKALERQFKIADAFLRGRNHVWECMGVWSLEIVRVSAVDEALEILMRIAERVPTSELAERALLRIGDYHFDEKGYRRAAEAYDSYLAMFDNPRMSPETESRVAYAHLHRAKAVYATYRNVKYDSTPLVNADGMFKAYVTRYLDPDRAQDDPVDKIIKEIADRRAAADYYVAELFERLDRPEAAAFFYGQAAERYGQTTWTARAQAARKRLARAPSKPDR